MAIHIYHPTKTVKGFACSFSESSKDGSFYASIIKQAGYDDKTGNGTFKDSLKDPNKHVNIKLSAIELGGILDCIERNRPFSSFHDAEVVIKGISFSPWMNKPIADEEGKTPAAIQNGFSFSVNVTNKDDKAKNSFYIGLNFAEARTIREYLIWLLHRRFDSGSNAKYADAPVSQENTVNNPE